MNQTHGRRLAALEAANRNANNFTLIVPEIITPGQRAVQSLVDEHDFEQ